MKATNDSVKIELQNVVTKNMHAWRFSPHAVPAEAYLGIRIDALRDKHKKIIEEQDLPVNEKGLTDYDKIEDADTVAKLSDINREILKLQMDKLSAVLTLDEALPQGYANERALLEDSISSYEIIPMIMNFFSKHSASSMVLPEDGTLPIRFIKPNGESFDPFPEWTKALRSGSPEKTSSTA